MPAVVSSDAAAFFLLSKKIQNGPLSTWTATRGNRLILNDLELRQQFPDAGDVGGEPRAAEACAEGRR